LESTQTKLNFSNTQKYETATADEKQKILEASCFFVAKDFRPFSSVNGEGLQV
jgi:hypothetical protein